MNCICHKYLTEESTALVLHTVQMNNEKNKALNKIDAGAKAKCLFAESDLLPTKKRKKKKKIRKRSDTISNIALNYWKSHEKLFTVCFCCIPFRDFLIFM